MNFYRSKYKGSFLDRAVSVMLRNKGKGSAGVPVYLEKDGIAVRIHPTEVPSLEGESLVSSNGMKEFLDVKLSKDEIATELGGSDTTASSQKAVKTYCDIEAGKKQDSVSIESGLNLDPETNTVSVKEEVFRVNDERLNEEVDWFTSIKSGKDKDILKELKKAVRSGKRRLDLIKEDTFNTEGNVSLSDDKIASNFSEGHITIPYTLKSTRNYILVGSFTLSDNLEEQTALCIFRTQDSHALWLRVTEDGVQLDYYNSRSAGGKATWGLDEVPLQPNKKVWFRINIEGTNSYCEINDIRKPIRDLSRFGSTSINLGANLEGSVFRGSIDLNDFKVFEDLALVAQAAFSIPYFISVNGKKVVEEDVLPRVLDYYNQAGYSTFFVLAGNEYILPTMEANEITRSFFSGCSGYFIRANRSALQQGKAEEGVRVTFLVPFRDTSYSVSIPYANKDKRGFTPTVSGDWIASGDVLFS